MLAAPQVDPLESTGEPLGGGLALDHPVAFAGSAPFDHVLEPRVKNLVKEQV